MGTLIEFLPTLDDEALARVWVELNCWCWPADLPVEFKPYWWDRKDLRPRNEHYKHGFTSPLHAYIESRVDADLIQRAWRKDQKIKQPA